MNIALAYVHPGTVRHEFMASVLETIADPRYDVQLISVESGTNVQGARNACLRRFLAESDAEHLLFVDTDISWDPDVIARLMAYDVPIVSAFYLGRDADGTPYPVGHSWMRTSGGEQMHRLCFEDMQGLVPVAGVGMGCCLIHRDVIEGLITARPLIHSVHPDNWPFAVGEVTSPLVPSVWISEDVNFCLRAADLGFGSYIASDVTVGHVKPFTLDPGGMPTFAQLREAM